MRDADGVRKIAVDLAGHEEGLVSGASVALNGNCLTVVSVQDAVARFDLIRETVDISNLGTLRSRDRVNVERSFRVGDEVGGHILSGHVATTVEVVAIDADEGHRLLTMSVPRDWMHYLMPKGFVALNGASLTIAELSRDNATFSVSLIPETLARTTYSEVAVGDRLNLEVDSQTQAVVDTVIHLLRDEHLLKSLSGGMGQTSA